VPARRWCIVTLKDMSGSIFQRQRHYWAGSASDGLAFAIFYTKVHDRLLGPLLAAYQPPARPPIRKALHTIDTHITQRIEDARLLPTAA
jgi:hypothetical protein